MKCKHTNLSHYEIIEAEHGTHYDCEGNVWFNNEYGGKIMDLVTCHDCEKSWKVSNSAPKFVREFDVKVKKDWIKKNN